MEIEHKREVMQTVEYVPIGIIESPHCKAEGMPIQPVGARGIAGRVILERKYVAGLRDLEGFSHIILLYHFHAARGYDLQVVPFLDTEPRGVLATRAPRRPNSIGLSVVRLVAVTDNILQIEDVDILDGTPLLDIKPYVPAFDHREDAVSGWLDSSAASPVTVQSDDRFAEPD